jgi:hypothetical protein
MPKWVIDFIVASIVPVGSGLMIMLYRVGNVMGRIDERLKAHEKDINDLQANWAASVNNLRPRGH